MTKLVDSRKKVRTVAIEIDTHKKLHHIAIEQDVQISYLINMALKYYLMQYKKGAVGDV